MNKIPKLERCPFCGSKARVETKKWGNKKGEVWYFIKCGGAGCIWPKPTDASRVCNMQPSTPGVLFLKEAVKLWNTRHKGN